MKEKKKVMDRVSYDEGLADFATRLDNDLNGLAMVAKNLNALASSRGADVCKALELNVHCLRMLERRMLDSAKRLPFANDYYFARQDPQPGEDFGIDDRDHL